MATILDGVWQGNDGALYYVRQSGHEVWWVGLSGDGGLQKGLTFCNVFRGAFERLPRIPGGLSTTLFRGDWADVPRGAARSLGFGTLSLHVVHDANGTATTLERRSATGGFGATLWTRLNPPPLEGSADAGSQFPLIAKNTYGSRLVHETLGDNLEIVKDAVVLFGTLAAGDNAPDKPFNDNFPKGEAPTLDNFWDENSPLDEIFTAFVDQHDGDVTCHVELVDTTALEASGFYSGMSAAHAAEVRQKIVAGFEAEIVMFARDRIDDSVIYLPGWAEQGGDSVLFNGVPLNGNVRGGDNWTAESVGGVAPVRGTPVRVTGPLVFDVGHSERGLEIHPVYALDLITATPRDDLTGVWGDVQGDTYYVHQVGQQVWALVAPPFHAKRGAVLFQGTRDGSRVTGSWTRAYSAAIPNVEPSTGDMGLAVGDAPKDACAPILLTVSGDSSLSGRTPRKLYDVDGHPCADFGQLRIVTGTRACAVDEVEGGTVEYRLADGPLATEPDLNYAWSTSAGDGSVVAGSGGARFQVANLPPAGTSVTVAADITTRSGCVYHAERTLVTLSAAQALGREKLCENMKRMAALVRRPPEPLPPGDPSSAPWLRAVRELHRAATELAKATEEILEDDRARSQ